MIPMHKVFMPENIDEVMVPLREVLKGGWIGEGPRVREFEHRIAQFLGTEKVTALNSCTSALQLALRLCEVGIGDEVITTPMTCMATNEPIVLSGATPVWADVQPDTGNIDPDSIRSKITLRTKVIMIVHWGGYPCDIAEIQAIAQEHGLKVVEDCAHAWGAVYRDTLVGNHSDFACFSLQAIKHFTTGDGGILVCKHEQDHMRARSLKWFGIDREQRRENELGVAEWDIGEAGYKFQMNDIAATIGLAQLPYLSDLLARRRENAAYYQKHLEDLEHAELLQEKDDRQSAYWLFTIKVDERERFIKHMKQAGVATSIVHMRNDLHSLFANHNRAGLTGLDEFAARMVCIPVGPWVGPAERDKIVTVIRRQEWLREKTKVIVVPEEEQEVGSSSH
ncbi:MAG: DegT/DnrJ/EryC1/StrS family aminotransferase [bacterium]